MNIDITKLTKSELAIIAHQMKEIKAAKSADRSKWTDIVDTMLRTKDDGSEFSHTTVEIWEALVEAGLEELDPSDESLDQEQRDSVLKRIQARKQLLAKKGEDVGYKAAPKTAITNYRFENVLNWLKRQELTQDQLIALGEIIEG